MPLRTKTLHICEDIVLLSHALSIARIPPIRICAESWRLPDHAPTFAFDFNLSTLVSTRRAHETQRAFNSVRTQFKYDASDAPSKEKKEDTPIRRQIYREMNAVLKEEQDRRINTGANRKTTWTASAPGGRSNEEMLSLVGNSANAELAAGQRAMNVSGVTSSGLGLLLLISHFERWPSGVPTHFPSSAFLSRSSSEMA